MTTDTNLPALCTELRRLRAAGTQGECEFICCRGSEVAAAKTYPTIIMREPDDWTQEGCRLMANTIMTDVIDKRPQPDPDARLRQLREFCVNWRETMTRKSEGVAADAYANVMQWIDRMLASPAPAAPQAEPVICQPTCLIEGCKTPWTVRHVTRVGCGYCDHHAAKARFSGLTASEDLAAEPPSDLTRRVERLEQQMASVIRGLNRNSEG